MIRGAVLLALVACLDPDTEPAPDAGIDAVSDAEPPLVDPCCDLLPDTGEVRACMLARPDAPPSGTCGRFVCPLPEGGWESINFCVP